MNQTAKIAVVIALAALLAFSQMPFIQASSSQEDDGRPPENSDDSEKEESKDGEDGGYDTGASSEAHEKSPDAPNKSAADDHAAAKRPGFTANGTTMAGDNILFCHEGNAICNYTILCKESGNLSGVRIIERMSLPANFSLSNRGCSLFACGECLNVTILDAPSANIVVENKGENATAALVFPEGFEISLSKNAVSIESEHGPGDFVFSGKLIAAGASFSVNESSREVSVNLSAGVRMIFRGTLFEGAAAYAKGGIKNALESALCDGTLGAEINVVRDFNAADYTVGYRGISVSETAKMEGKAAISIDSDEGAGCFVALFLDNGLIGGKHPEPLRITANGKPVMRLQSPEDLLSGSSPLSLGADKYAYYLDASGEGLQMMLWVPHFSILELEIVDLDKVFPAWIEEGLPFDDALEGLLGVLSTYGRENIGISAGVDIGKIEFSLWRIITGSGSLKIETGITLECEISVIELTFGLTQAILQSASETPLDLPTLLQLLDERQYLTADELRIMLTGPVREYVKAWALERVKQTVEQAFPDAEYDAAFEFYNLDPKIFDPELHMDPVRAIITVNLRIDEKLALSEMMDNKEPPNPEIEELKQGKGLAGILSYPNLFNLEAKPGWKFDIVVSLPENYRFVYAHEEPAQGGIDTSSLGWNLDARESANPLSRDYIAGVTNLDMVRAVTIMLFSTGAMIALCIGLIVWRAARKKRSKAE
ncbi:MAG: hypothetical protein CVT48_00190 [Thermoplasmata archaeon HGW-Thermoplasmata-1]|nr:MAG: hypothetical protein CVT48_00190 [Thermoplasmata archaeon HGW-Thermoplasmata-1]